MKGLILKDFYMVRKYCRSYLIIVTVFSAMSIVLPFLDHGTNTMFLSSYLVLMAGILPMNLISYDEKSKWSQYAGIFPYTKREMVSVKYLGMLIFLGIGVILAALAQGINMAVSERFQWEAYTLILVTFLLGGMISPCILLPVVFWFGVEKGRIIYFCVLVLFFAAVSFSQFVMKEDLPSLSVLKEVWFLPVVLLCGILFLAASWWISIKGYEKREW